MHKNKNQTFLTYVPVTGGETSQFYKLSCLQSVSLSQNE